MNPREVRHTVLIALAIGILTAGAVIAQGPSEDPEIWVSQAKPIVIDQTLEDLPPRKLWLHGDPIRQVNPRRVTRPEALTRPVPVFEAQPDPLLPLQLAAPKTADKAFTSPNVNVEGQGFGGGFPPDTVGAVGTTHYVQMINNAGGSSVQAYDKATGAAVLGAPTPLSSLAPAGDPCSTGGAGDPIPVFDQLANRWLLTEFTGEDTGFHLCAYVSSGADPTTSTWTFYRFDTPSFPDYPKYAVWPDAYYIGTNETGTTAVYAIDRTQMLAGAAATLIRRTTSQLPGFAFQLMAPVDLDGATPPPAGSPGIFIRHRDDESHDPPGTAGSDKLEIYEFAADFTTPANSTLTGPTNIAVAEFESDLCGLTDFFCFPQPGTAQKLDPLREPVMHRPVFRNFGTHQALVGNFVTDVDGGGADRGGIRWFELRRAAAAATGGWSLFQEGTVSAADGMSRWMGSIAMDQDGNMALGYSATGPSAGQFPSIRYTGRQSGDLAGTMPQSETEIVAGGDSQTDAERWGDYSALTVDPSDDCTFWYTNEYIPSGNNNLWSTRIGSFSFSSCGAGGADPTLTVTKAGTGTGTVTSNPAGIDCGADCTEQYPQSTQVTLTAAPGAGSTFTGWSGGGCSGTGTCVVALNSDTTVTATFVAEVAEDCDGAICLNANRFQVDVDWRTAQGGTGQGQAVPGVRSDDSGVLFFFTENNWEMLIKVLDGCAITNHFWVFAAATTDVEYTLKVTDNQTGTSKSYFNPLGTAAASITDTSALAVCNGGTLSESSGAVQTVAPSRSYIDELTKQSTCTQSATNLCLSQDRFQVEVDWRTAAGGEGSGQVVPFAVDDSGLFFFFTANNWEMLVKVLDGCGITNHFWVFAAATTDVGYTLKVTDTANGTVKEYTNPIGNAAAAITDTSAFATCP